MNTLTCAASDATENSLHKLPLQPDFMSIRVWNTDRTALGTRDPSERDVLKHAYSLLASLYHFRLDS
jgi:hypothetical protein